MKSKLPPRRRPSLRTRFFVLALAAAGLSGRSAQAADVVHTTTTAGTSYNTATWTNGVPNAAGDIARYLGAATTMTLDIDATIGSLQGSQGAGALFTFASNGTNVLTLNGTGISAANQGFNNAGVASIIETITSSSSRPMVIGSTTTGLTINMASDLDIGTSASSLTLYGTINNTSGSAKNLNFRNFTPSVTPAAGGLTINSAIGSSGSAIAISNLGATTTAVPVTLAGVLGTSVSSVTQNSAFSTMSLTNAANTYTGATIINAGTLNVSTLAAGGANSSIGASSNAAANLVINGGIFRYTGGTVTTDRNFTIGDNNATIDSSSTGSLTMSGTASFATANAARSLTFTGTAGTPGVTATGVQTFTGVLADNGSGTLSVVKSGTGVWQFSGASTYTGGTTLNAGEIQLNSATALGSGSSTLTINGGSLNSRGATRTLSNPVTVGGDFGLGSVNIGVAINFSGTVNLGGAARTVTVADNTTLVGAETTWSGAVSNGGLIKTGAGMLTLTAAGNSYSGGTTVNGGVLATGTTGSFGTGNVTIADAAGNTLTLQNTASIADSAILTFGQTNSVINMNFNGTEVLGSITNGTQTIPNGTYSAANLNSFFGGTDFTGTGIFQVVASPVPEPGTWAAILVSGALLAWCLPRRRRLS